MSHLVSSHMINRLLPTPLYLVPVLLPKLIALINTTVSNVEPSIASDFKNDNITTWTGENQPQHN